MKVKNADEFYKILERKAIYPVFQPIVNLQTGDVAGYEALSRIDRHDTTLMISDLFVIAEQVGCVWKLEKLCRNKALKAAANKPEHAKLFLNVDGNRSFRINRSYRDLQTVRLRKPEYRPVTLYLK